MEEILNSSVADAASYHNYVEGIIKDRNDAKLNPRTILFSGLQNYARYGKLSPYTDKIPGEELFEIDPDELTALTGTLCSYPHRVFYYGPGDADDVEELVVYFYDHEGKDETSWPPPASVPGAAGLTPMPQAIKVVLKLKSMGEIWRLLEIPGA